MPLDSPADKHHIGGMNLPATINPTEALEAAYPLSLPVEIALQVAPVREICEAYGITKERFRQLLDNPVFLEDLRRAREMVRQDGMTFKLKAQLQSGELLKTSWTMIHNEALPATVRADLLKFTVRVAGLDASKDQAANAAQVPGLNIQINL